MEDETGKKKADGTFANQVMENAAVAKMKAAAGNIPLPAGSEGV